jgi:hypothetical protein
MLSAMPVLMNAAQDRNPKIKALALRRIGELGGQPELPWLLDRLAKAESAAEQGALEQALTAVVARVEYPRTGRTHRHRLLPQRATGRPSRSAPGPGVAGGPTALKTVVQAAGSENTEVRGAALRTLSTWKTADAAPELLLLTRSASEATDRILCLRGYLGWVRSGDLPAEQRLTMAREVAALIDSDEEKRMFLGAVGSIRSTEALPMIVPHLDQEATRNEAAAAVLTIAEPLLKAPTDPAASVTLRNALQQAVKAVPAGDLADRLGKLLSEADSRAGGA